MILVENICSHGCKHTNNFLVKLDCADRVDVILLRGKESDQDNTKICRRQAYRCGHWENNPSFYPWLFAQRMLRRQSDHSGKPRLRQTRVHITQQEFATGQKVLRSCSVAVFFPIVARRQLDGFNSFVRGGVKGYRTTQCPIDRPTRQCLSADLRSRRHMQPAQEPQLPKTIITVLRPRTQILQSNDDAHGEKQKWHAARRRSHRVPKT